MILHKLLKNVRILAAKDIVFILLHYRFMQDFQLEVLEMEISFMWKSMVGCTECRQYN